MDRAGLKCVIGACLIQMFNGSFFLWAQISIYCLSYFKMVNGKKSQVDENLIYQVDAIMSVFNVVGF